MNKEELVKITSEKINQLPIEMINEVADFTEFLLKKLEENSLQKGMQQLMSESKAFEFLKDEEDLYTLDDLKERYK